MTLTYVEIKLQLIKGQSDKLPTPDTDILNSDAFAIVNPVNCLGVMGKGLAKQVAKRYPQVLRRYKKRCDAGEFQPGMIQKCPLPDGRIILNASTKGDWHDPSKIEWVESILIKIVENYQQLGITSLALPALGCGLGKLSWNQVGPLIAQYLGDLPIPVTVYIARGMVHYQLNEENDDEERLAHIARECGLLNEEDEVSPTVEQDLQEFLVEQALAGLDRYQPEPEESLA